MPAPNAREPVETTHTVLVLNPHSRSGGETVAAVVDRLLDLGPVHAIRTPDPGTARRAILRFGGPASRVVVGGGDGTLSTLLDAILESGSVLGVLPLGTANDFARSLGIPLDLAEAARILVDGQMRRVDVGEVNGKLFLNAVGVGVGPTLTRELDDGSKRQLGVLAYPMALLSVLKDAEPFHARLEVDGRVHDLDCLQVTIGNGIHYGGGLTISDDARLDNGELRVLCIRDRPKLKLASQAMNLRFGTAEDADDIRLFSGRSVRLRTDMTLDATADGELVASTPLECRSRPRALTVMAPARGEDCAA